MAKNKRTNNTEYKSKIGRTMDLESGKGKRKGKPAETAEDFLHYLQTNPEYLARMAEKNKRRAARIAIIEEVEKPILEDLAAVGIHESLEHFVNSSARIPPKGVEVLLGWLSRIDQPNVLEMVIRALGAPEEPYDGRPLAKLFDEIHSMWDCNIRWVIGNTINCALPTNITDWVIRTLQNHKYASSRRMLCYALIRMIPKNEAVTILLSAFDSFIAIQAAQALGKIGDESVLEFLAERRKEYAEKILQEKKGTIPYNGYKTSIKEIDKAIVWIQKRAEKQRLKVRKLGNG